MNELVFPIITIPNVVLFPRTEIGLFLNKKTQIKLIDDCLKYDQLFLLALGTAKEEKEEPTTGLKTYVSKKICTLAIPSNPSKISNNTLKFVATGTRRVSLKRLIQDIPYSTYEVEYIDDWKEEVTFHQSLVGRLRKILFTWIDNYIESSLDRENLIDQIESISDISAMISNYIVDDPSIKQILLEERSLAERIKILSSLLKPENPFHLDPEIVRGIKDFKNN